MAGLHSVESAKVSNERVDFGKVAMYEPFNPPTPLPGVGRKSRSPLTRSLFWSRFESGEGSRSGIRNGVRLPATRIDRMRTTDEAAVYCYMSFQTVAGFNGELSRLFSGPV